MCRLTLFNIQEFMISTKLLTEKIAIEKIYEVTDKRFNSAQKEMT